MARSASELAATLTGLSEAEAEARVESEGLTWRVVTRDGTAIPVTADLRSNRISVEIRGGEVLRARVG